jgi:nitrogen fixation protein NifB
MPIPRLGAEVVTLPIAPRQVARPRFGAPLRQAAAKSAEDAVASLVALVDAGLKITEVELEGPGDPLATPDLTLAALALLRRHYPNLPCRLVSLGLGGAELAENLAACRLNELTLLVDAVDPAVICQLYAWIRPGNHTVAITEAAQILIAEQRRTVKACKAAGLRVNIRATLYPGHNDKLVAEIAAGMAGLGADSMTVVPFRPGNDEENCSEPPSEEMLQEAQDQAAAWLAVANEPRRLSLTTPAPGGTETGIPQPSREHPNLAVISTDGLEVDLHLGEAAYVMIYGPREDGLHCLLGTRPAPEPGSGKARWQSLAETLNDCFALLTAGAGDSPRRVLANHGIAVLITEGAVDGLVDVLYGGGRKRKRESRNIQPQNTEERMKPATTTDLPQRPRS